MTQTSLMAIEQSVRISHVQPVLGPNRIADMEGQPRLESDLGRRFVKVIVLVSKGLKQSFFEIKCIAAPIRYQKR